MRLLQCLLCGKVIFMFLSARTPNMRGLAKHELNGLACLNNVMDGTNRMTSHIKITYITAEGFTTDLRYAFSFLLKAQFTQKLQLSSSHTLFQHVGNFLEYPFFDFNRRNAVRLHNDSKILYMAL